uniref:Uncharacterized protein LOC104222165 n=1 Tax=Nicotiana sylvestris TaxID=4096 RepID=A0A1U7WAH5_NICSY|nr:PREDICTED: uncharacterized protein LOC104222165 [Nicotiana sylvestris]
MEDQICRTNEDSIKIVIAEIRSLLHELVGNVETSKPTRLEFRRFCGENPELWISQAERYFKFYGMSENNKLLLASSYLDGEALKWYQWLFRNKQLADWEHFTANRRKVTWLQPGNIPQRSKPRCSTKCHMVVVPRCLILSNQMLKSLLLASSYLEEGALKVRFALLHEKFRIGQVLPLQSGITLDDCHRFETYDCYHIGACTYYHLEFDAVLWIVPFYVSLDNWLDTGQNSLGCASIAKEYLNIASDAVEMLEGVFKRSRGLIANLYAYECVGGVDMGIESYGTFKTSCASYKLLGGPVENSLMCLFEGVSTQLMEQFNAPVGQCDICANRELLFSLGRVNLLGRIKSSRKVSLVAVHYADKMEPVIWLLQICLGTFLEASVICNQVHESYCQRVYVIKSHALCASRAMTEKSMLAKVGQVMDSYFSALEFDVPMNYRAFLSWFTMLNMLKDTLLWSNYIYNGVSGGLPLQGVRNLSKGLLECVLQGNNYHGTSEHTTHQSTVGLGCTWRGHSTNTILESNLEDKVLIEGREYCYEPTPAQYGYLQTSSY